MPYTYKKEGDKYVVYKKDGGKRVGATAGNKTALKKYLAALHMYAEAVVNENYRDPKDNVAILYAMLKKGGREQKYVKDLMHDIKMELNIVINPADPKATLKLAMKNDELADYLDNAVEDALDDGMGRVRGMFPMSGIREAVVKKDDLDKIGDYVMASPAFEHMGSSKLKTVIKDMYHEWKAVASHYKNIEAYFNELEKTGGNEAFMENKKIKENKDTTKLKGLLKEFFGISGMVTLGAIGSNPMRVTSQSPAAKVNEAIVSPEELAEKIFGKNAFSQIINKPKSVYMTVDDSTVIGGKSLIAYQKQGNFKDFFVHSIHGRTEIQFNK